MKKEKLDLHLNEGKKSITLWFDNDGVERLDRMARKGNLARSELMRNLCMVGVEYLEKCEKFGVLQTALVMRDLGEWVKSKIDEKEYSDYVIKE